MKTTVNLQDPFSYSVQILYIIAFLFGICILIFLFPKIKEAASKLFAHKKKTKNIVVNQRNSIEKTWIRNKYLAELAKLENGIISNTVSVRESYQQMSECIRKFVFEMTGIKVQNYTLQDIKTLNMPLLEQLISEYYQPEFAKESVGDRLAALKRTREAIMKWN